MLVTPEQRVSGKSTVCTEGRYAGAVFHTRLGKAEWEWRWKEGLPP